MEHAFYEPAGAGLFASSPATAGPWSPDAQHGGPPSALAARAIELHEPDGRQRLARVAIDILRPIPLRPLSVLTRTVRPGRRIALIETVLQADGQDVLHARGWRIERPASKVPEIAEAGTPPPVPAEGDGLQPLIFQREPAGYLASIDWKFLPAESDLPATAQVRSAWTRPRIPLLAGEEPSPMQRTLLVADSGSGVSAALPPTEFIFINVDLTVSLARDPESEWILLEAATTIGADGTGMALTRLSDSVGAFGRGLQTLLVAPR